MKQNMSSADRIIRILVAAIVSLLYFTNVITGTLATVLLVFSGVFILTGLLGSCPLYSLLGFSTCPAGKKAVGSRQ
jgi:hypothetical protein